MGAILHRYATEIGVLAGALFQCLSFFLFQCVQVLEPCENAIAASGVKVFVFVILCYYLMWYYLWKKRNTK